MRSRIPRFRIPFTVVEAVVWSTLDAKSCSLLRVTVMYKQAIAFMKRFGMFCIFFKCDVMSKQALTLKVESDGERRYRVRVERSGK